MFFLDMPEPGIARLTIDAPERRNAISVADWERLAALLSTVPDCARVLLIGGREDFSAGADLREFARMLQEPDAVASFRNAMRRAIDGLAGLPIPTIAVIAGGCYGAGVALAIAADLRLAAEAARFAVTPAKLGIGYPAADVARLSALVGRGHAARLLFAAERIDAHRAESIGLVEAVTPDVWVAAFELARGIAANSGASMRMLKRMLADPAGDHNDAFDALFAGPDLAEGLAAYRKRRPARFA